MGFSVEVTNIAAETKESAVRDLFAFCGSIESIVLKPASGKTQKATIVFEKIDAAGTAAILDGTTLEHSTIHVARSPDSSPASSADTGREYPSEKDVPQEDKPRRRIIVELIAKGYTISEGTITRALDLDKKYGVSRRFEEFLKGLDTRFKAQERAHDIDAKYDVTGQLAAAWGTYFAPYVQSASQTSGGVKLREFYNTAWEEVSDVLNEAKWVREQQSSGACTCSTLIHHNHSFTVCSHHVLTHRFPESHGSPCTCTPGSCTCADCPKSTSEKSTSGSQKCGSSHCQKSAGECAAHCKHSTRAGEKSTSGCVCPSSKCQCSNTSGSSDKNCGCNSDASKCPCPEGKCACSGCPKSTGKDCGCGSKAEKCPCPDGKCECAGCPKRCKCPPGEC